MKLFIYEILIGKKEKTLKGDKYTNLVNKLLNCINIFLILK